MAMETARENEIARAILKHMLKEQGFEIDQNFRRGVGNIAKRTNIPFGEVLEFETKLAAEILAEVSEPTKEPTKEELEGYDGHHHHHGGH